MKKFISMILVLTLLVTTTNTAILISAFVENATLVSTEIPKLTENANLPETTTVEETKVVDEEVTLELMEEKRVMLMSYGNATVTVTGKVVDSNGNGINNEYVDTCGIAVNPKAFISVIADTDYSS